MKKKFGLLKTCEVVKKKVLEHTLEKEKVVKREENEITPGSLTLKYCNAYTVSAAKKCWVFPKNWFSFKYFGRVKNQLISEKVEMVFGRNSFTKKLPSNFPSKKK